MNTIQLYDFEPEATDVLHEIIAGLRQTPKSLSAKFNYDEQGAKLYEAICQTSDYYLTRTELAIMHQHAQEIGASFDDDILLIEYGSGNGKKTRFLFDHLPSIIGYIPIDISKEQLIEISTKLAIEYPQVEVLPVCADYTQSFTLPQPIKHFARRLVYYPGSTIGNIHPNEAIRFLRQIRQHCQPDDALLIGVDLQKDPALLEQAYDDREGITRHFNHINPLTRFNRDFGTDFMVTQYQHCVSYNHTHSRVDIHLQSLCDQTVHLNGDTIHLRAGELIERAVAYKYSVNTFQRLAQQGGWQVEEVWTDAEEWFSVQYLTAL